MGAGTYRHFVEIERRVEVGRDAAGGVLHEWQLVAQLYASVEPLNGREAFEAAQLDSRVSGRIKLRTFDPELCRADDRVRFRGRIFNVLGVRNPDERSRELVLSVEEHVAGSDESGGN